MIQEGHLRRIDRLIAKGSTNCADQSDKKLHGHDVHAKAFEKINGGTHGNIFITLVEY